MASKCIQVIQIGLALKLIMFQKEMETIILQQSNIRNGGLVQHNH